MTLKKKNSRLAFIVVIVCIVLFIALLSYEFIARSFNLNSLMGNSITTTFYYCEDSTYTLNNNMCIKTNTKPSSILGDVNSDSKVDNIDSEILNQYLAKKLDLTEEQLIAADVNSDGIISVGDAENIRLYLNGHVAGSDYLSKIGNVNVCPKNYDLKNNICVEEISVKAKEAQYKRGDINLDGVLDSKDIDLLNDYLNKQSNLSNLQLNIADYNANGTVDINDLNELTKDLKVKSDDNLVIGDINLDKTVNSNDVILLEKYLTQNINLDDEVVSLADIDKSGKVDVNDLQLLAKKVSDFYQIGDINLDGIVDTKDLTLLQNYFNKITNLNKVQLNLIDINGDSTFNNDDIIVLRGKVLNLNKYKNGDVNMDGKLSADDVSIIEQYILAKTTLTFDQMSLADYNKDNKIDNLDANGLAETIANNYKTKDINMDGKINILDINLLSDYLLNLKQLNTVQKILADTNKDGKVSADDLLTK